MMLCTVISRKYAHPPFLNEVVAKGAFLSKARPPTCAVVHVVMVLYIARGGTNK